MRRWTGGNEKDRTSAVPVPRATFRARAKRVGQTCAGRPSTLLPVAVCDWIYGMVKMAVSAITDIPRPAYETVIEGASGRNHLYSA